MCRVLQWEGGARTGEFRPASGVVLTQCPACSKEREDAAWGAEFAQGFAAARQAWEGARAAAAAGEGSGGSSSSSSSGSSHGAAWAAAAAAAATVLRIDGAALAAAAGAALDASSAAAAQRPWLAFVGQLLAGLQELHPQAGIQTLAALASQSAADVPATPLSL